MKITRKINLNVKETVERSVSGNSDFHFYVDELSSNNYMPTYSGMADEKYKFDDMDDEYCVYDENDYGLNHTLILLKETILK